MEILKHAQAGSLESNDVLIQVDVLDTLNIELTSIVFDEFSEEIYRVVNETLNELKITKGHILINDRGALDYTIKARLISAIERSNA